MDLNIIEQYDVILDRYRAWLECDIIDRPPVWINVEQGHDRIDDLSSHCSLKERWFDGEYQVEQFSKRNDEKVFLGDTVPIFMPNLGPDICATLFGCELEFGEDTSWSHPVMKSCEEVLGLEPNFDNPFWKKIKDMTNLSLELGAGKWITGITDLHTNGDILSALVGPENLCMEIMDNPQLVKSACEHVTDCYARIFEQLYEPIHKHGHPSTTWAPCLYQGKMYITNCDFICLISERDFQNIILPSIIREMRYLDKNVFHLDGPQALRHIDALLELPELDGLQWVYGAGNGPSSKWIDVYKKVQSKGKCLDLLCESIDDAITLTEQLKPEGLWFHIFGTYTKEDAGNFIKYIHKWTSKRK